MTPVRIAGVLLGIATMGVALWADHLAKAAGGMRTVSWLGLVIGLALAVAAALGRNIAEHYRSAALVLLNTVVALVVLELLATVVYAIVGPPSRREAVRRAGGAEDASASMYYDTVSWAKAYWEEFERAHHNQYRPFYIWRLRPFAGRLIHVDSAGIRDTPGARCTTDAYRVFVLGGSSVWGLGSPDSASIPADLQSLLSARLRRPVCVRNLGQLGFTTAQDLVQLEAVLRTGDVPDLALFYGGSNDIATSFISGQTGVHFDLWRIKRAYEEMRRPPRPVGFVNLLTQSNLYRLAQVIVQSAPATRVAAALQPGHDSDSLANAIVVAFVNHHRQAEILGRGYGFKVAFFWQPTVTAGGKRLTEEEQRSVTRNRDSEFAARVHARARARIQGVPGLYNLADVFANDTGQRYIDSHHLTPEANRIVAQAILDRIQDQLPGDAPPP